MSDDVPHESQSNMTFEDAPQRFRDKHPDDRFDGASGILFEQAMSQTRMAICLSDPNAEDHPLVFVNRAFTRLTGYDESEVVGKNCRFLQGPGTDPAKVRMISDALAREEVVVVELLNYRKGGQAFWNALHLGPIFDEKGKLIYYFGSQWDVSDVHAARADEQHARALARELSHRIKNIFAVIGGIVTVTGRARNFRDEAREINERIHALARAFETTLDEASTGAIDIGTAIRSVLKPYDAESERLDIEGETLRVSPNVVSTVGLTLHELATNAIKYGALSNETGRVRVRWHLSDQGDDIVLDWSEMGGPVVTEPKSTKGTGIGIIENLLSYIDGRIERDFGADGFEAKIVIPAAK